MTLSAIAVLMSAFVGKDFQGIRAMSKLTCEQNTYNRPRHRSQRMNTDLASELEKEHRAGDRGLDAGPALQLMILRPWKSTFPPWALFTEP